MLLFNESKFNISHVQSPKGENDKSAHFIVVLCDNHSLYTRSIIPHNRCMLHTATVTYASCNFSIFVFKQPSTNLVQVFTLPHGFLFLCMVPLTNKFLDE